MTKLYELTGNLQRLNEIASSDSSDQELSEALQETINSNELEFNDKAVGIVQIATAMSGDTEAIDNEIKRLQARKKAIVNRKQSLIDYLRINMEASDIKKIECPYFSITLKGNGDVVEVFDDKALPDDYIRIKTDIAPDKKAIATALKDGVDIPGARLIKSKSSILIK